ncbi:hypothetical protein B0H14DRAFT_2589849 [Mycena olivaceomarginata]|nr:hypothetical protein B0H14DRAFT_2589849 [Mycena olivaceomarginata]
MFGHTESSASRGNVVEVTGLLTGTTSDDVVTVFKHCGEIGKVAWISNRPEVTVRVFFMGPSAASTAVPKFHNQRADGKVLSVRIVETDESNLNPGITFAV